MRNILIPVLLLSLFTAACNGNKKDEKQVSNPTGASRDAAAHTGPNHAGQRYTCPMHPQVLRDEPGDCPICGMHLVPVKAETGNRQLVLTATQVRLGNITTMAVGNGELGRNTVINGRLVANEEASEVISARSAGRIEKLFIKQTGVRVNKGQPLYQLYSEELQTLEEEYLLGVAQYREMGKDNPRYLDFLKAAEKKLELFGLSRNQILALGKAGAASPRITFESPTSGIITEISAAEGEYLPEGGTLYRLENLSELWAEGELYPEEARQVKMGSHIKVLAPTATGEPLDARVSFLSPELQAGSQLTLMRATIRNAALQLQPGMQVQVVLSQSASAAITVPLTAIVRDAAGATVYVETGKRTFEPRKVRIGSENEDTVEITAGLKPGELIAKTGAYLIHSELVLKKGEDMEQL